MKTIRSRATSETSLREHRTQQELNMDKGRCTVLSLNKAYNGKENGTLLRALPNDKLYFDGTDGTNSDTSFIRINKGNTCTFNKKKNGINYYICEWNDSILLKRVGSNVFQICNIPKYPSSIVLIKAKRSGLYLTADEYGRITMKPINKTSIARRKVGHEALFIIEGVEDSTDGVSTDANNNQSISMLETAM